MLLLLLLVLSPLVNVPPTTAAERIPGFVSLDCGSSSNYTDPSTTIFWETDSSYGLAAASSTATVVPPSSSLRLVSNAQLTSIRYFPAGNNQTKYCYTFEEGDGITPNSTYLVRATFWAGSSFPLPPKSSDGVLRFQLLLGADVWTNVSIPIPQISVVQKEVYVVALSSSLSVCLSGSGLTSVDSALGSIFDTPFISSLEIRHIPIDEEDINPLRQAVRPSSSTSRAVHLVYRLDYGSSTGRSVRYPTDDYDRIWQGQTSAPQINTTNAIADLLSANHVPLPVMQTAYTYDGSYFYLNLTSAVLSGSRGGYATSLYFAEISSNVTGPGQRIFNYAISTDTSNGPLKYRNNIDLYRDVGKYAVFATYSQAPYITLNDGGYIFLNFTRNDTSFFGPLLSALELYNISDHDASSGTDDADAAGVSGIRKAFPSALASWSGDPCLPYPIDWLRCNTSQDRGPRIISLSLAHKGLSGVIPAAIANLTALQILDLQGNNLSGSIPAFFGSLPYLTTLLLQDNNLSGDIPSSLLDKVASRVLNLSVSGNPYLAINQNVCATSSANSTSSNSCNDTPTKSKSNTNVPLVVGASIGAVLFLILVVITVICLVKKSRSRKGKKNVVEVTCDNGTQIATQMSTLSKEKEAEAPNVANLDVTQIYCFTYQDISEITNSFSRRLGRGGFGDVFYGRLKQGIEVAIKVSSQNSLGGAQAFLNEVALLSRVHHRNLVKLIGYCEDIKLILVYEYMPNGSLASILQGNQRGALTFPWTDRLKIAIGAANGLEYLHNGCTPPIIHRDVKSSNILLDATMEGKISDFGISRSTLGSSADHTVTNIVGSRGYIPPDIMNANKINQKVDVYAFGVVLLELVTGRKPILTDGYTQHHITDWVKSKIEAGRLQDIVDPTIGHTYNESAMWKVIDVALMCVLSDNQKRPQMSDVSLELRNSSSMEAQENYTTGFSTSDLIINSNNMNLYVR